MAADDADRLYFRQLLSGRDFAAGNQLAAQMVNFAYLIGDRATGEVLVVDPAYGVDDLLTLAEADGMTVVGVLATHYHADHVGGSLLGHGIEGVAALLERRSVPIHVQAPEAPLVARAAGVSLADLVAHGSGDRVVVGAVDVELLHTPGHTPGSQCFLVGGLLVSGDTLFLDGCGRTDLPGSDPAAMYESLQRLAALPGGTVVCPGHRYSPAPQADLDTVRQLNMVYKPPTREAWLAAFGRP